MYDSDRPLNDDEKIKALGALVATRNKRHRKAKWKHRREIAGIVLIAVGGFAACCVPVAAVLYVAAKMFEYNLWTFTNVDLPWWGDLLGAILTNGFSLIWFLISLIIRCSGTEIPLFPIHHHG